MPGRQTRARSKRRALWVPVRSSVTDTFTRTRRHRWSALFRSPSVGANGCPRRTPYSSRCGRSCLAWLNSALQVHSSAPWVHWTGGAFRRPFGRCAPKTTLKAAQTRGVRPGRRPDAGPGCGTGPVDRCQHPLCQQRPKMNPMATLGSTADSDDRRNVAGSSCHRFEDRCWCLPLKSLTRTPDG